MNNTTMNAIVCNQYGGAEVLEYTQVAIPTPKDNEILVRIKATSVTAASIFMRTGKPLLGRLVTGLTKPKVKIQGTDLAGEIIAVGKLVKKHTVGDQIIAATDLNCGSYAEYICLKEDNPIVKRPKNMTAIEATGMIDGATTALAFLRDVISLKEGQKILINGASGSIGTAAIQLAKYFGAEVTAVCSGKNSKLVASLGADHIIDYAKEDFTKRDTKYDVIFDTVVKLNYSSAKKALKKEGTFITPGLDMSILMQIIGTAMFSSKKVKFSATGARANDLKQRDLLFLKELIEAGKFKTVIDRLYPLNEIQAAHRYIETGRKVGNVVIDLQ